MQDMSDIITIFLIETHGKPQLKDGEGYRGRRSIRLAAACGGFRLLRRFLRCPGDNLNLAGCWAGNIARRCCSARNFLRARLYFREADTQNPNSKNPPWKAGLHTRRTGGNSILAD
jgi:hypothetical protein